MGPGAQLPGIAADWSARLRGSLGRPLHVFSELDSSLDTLAALAAAGAPAGTCVATELQRRGRGRRGSAWLSRAGESLLLALLLRPGIAAQSGGLISLAASLALVRAGAGQGLSLQVKWPNDVLHDGRKVAGILPEARLGAGGYRQVLLGIGVNVHQRSFPPELGGRASSLDRAAGRRCERGDLFAALLWELELLLSELERGEARPLIAGWLAAWPHQGRLARDGDGRELELLGLGELGELRVRGPGGEEALSAGDLTLLESP